MGACHAMGYIGGHDPEESRDLIGEFIDLHLGKSDDGDSETVLSEHHPRGSPNQRTEGGDTMREAERADDRSRLPGMDEGADGEAGAKEDISPQYPDTTGGESGIQAFLETGKCMYKPRAKEGDSPQPTVSISQSVSAVGTAVLEGMQTADPNSSREM